MTNVTLAFKDKSSKLIDAVSVADVCAEVRVEWTVNGEHFGQQFGRDFWSWSLVEIMNLNFDQDAEAQDSWTFKFYIRILRSGKDVEVEIWSRITRQIFEADLIEILMLKLCRNFGPR